MFSQITTCCRTLASTLRVVRDNVWILLRLTCCIVSGVLVLLSSAYTIWKIPTSDSVCDTICSIQYEHTLKFLLFLNPCLFYLVHNLYWKHK